MTHTRFLPICVFNRKHNCVSCPFIDFGLKTQSRSLLFKETHALLNLSSLPWGNTFWTHPRFPSTLLAWLGNTIAFIRYCLFKRENTYVCRKHKRVSSSALLCSPLLQFQFQVCTARFMQLSTCTAYLPFP